jgi:uncharacterized protein YndB with AHSA1/START domain
MRNRIHLLFLLLSASQLLAEPAKDYPRVDDTSYTEPNGNRVIRLAIDIAAPAEDVWRAFTTAEGWKSFAVAFASVDMQVGGLIETSYNPKAQVGDPDNIKNEIVAYAPGRILAIRCVQAPRNFAHKQEFFGTSTLIEVVPLKKRKTQVVITAAGYRVGQAYDDLFKMFRWGNAYTLEKLRQSFEGAPPARKTGPAGGDRHNPKSETRQ